MLTLLLILSCLVILFFAMKSTAYKKKNPDEPLPFFDFVMMIILAIVATFLLIEICCEISELGTSKTISQKIEMYEEENSSIEESIATTVKGYMNFEASTYAELKDTENIINLVSLYPELKSDTLVQQQIEVYINNSQKIKELREEQIDLAKIRWNLYFGK